MDSIKKIEINKIKGIEYLNLELTLLPNLPSIFVAPNGYGKSSLTVAFDSLLTNRLNLKKEHYFNSVNNNDSFLKIIEEINREDFEYIATKNSNTISDRFDIFVINNKVEAVAKTINFGEFKQAIPSKEIKDLVIVNTIPDNKKIIYRYPDYAFRYGKNKKIVPNLSDFVRNGNNVIKMYGIKDSFNNIIRGTQTISIIQSIIEEVNFLSGTKEEILNKINNEITNNLYLDRNIAKISDTFEYYGHNEKEKLIFIFEIIEIYKNNKDIFKISKDRCEYELYKIKIKDLFKSFNRRSNQVNIHETGGKLVATFPKAHMLSNGEIDILTFILLLEQAKIKLKKENNILIIDEIFDYLDDVNLITAQHYISNFISDFREKERNIYPIIMTHLDSNVFENFYFGKMKVYYLKEIDNTIGKDAVNLIRNRDKFSDDQVSKSFLHFYNEPIDITSECVRLNLSTKYNNSQTFKTESYKNLVEYCNDNNADNLLVICALRLCVEEYLYYSLDSEEEKNEFLKTHYTKNKIDFVEGKDIYVPEVFKLLSIIYNDAMHINSKKDPHGKKIFYLASKLNNLIIKQMVISLKNEVDKKVNLV